MEVDTPPSQKLMCRTLFVAELKVEPIEANDSKIMPWCENGKVVDEDLYLESTLCLKESSYNKWETTTFEKIKVESSDRNIDQKLDDIIVLPDIKKETNDLTEITDKTLNYSHENFIKSEALEQDEFHIKHEDHENKLNEKCYASQPETIQQEEVYIKSNEDEDENKIIQKSGNQLLLLHQCSECPYRTTYKSNLKRHLVKHTKTDKVDWYSCQECPYKTCRKDNLKAHVSTHNTSVLKCPQCSYETFRATDLKQHQIKHKTNIKWLHCPECSFQTHQPSRIQKHILAHKSDSFKCSKCSYQSRTKGQLTVHQVKHESMDKWHFCPMCPYKTYNKSLLKTHCLVPHSADPSIPKLIEIFKCTECPYESRYKPNVTTHQFIHHQSSGLQSSDCAYKTADNTINKKHQGENEERWHKCPECSYKTSSLSSLRHHVISHKSVDKIRLFECSQCSFKTARKDHLKQHQLKHKEAQDIDWFCCYECSFKSKYKSSIRKHVWKHKKQIEKDYLLTK